MTMTVVIKEQMRVLVGETLADIYRQLRSLAGREESFPVPKASVAK